MMRKWWEKVDLLIASPASCMTWAHQDSPLRARKRTEASRCGLASAASSFGSSMSSASGATTASISPSAEIKVAMSSTSVVQFEIHRTSIVIEHASMKEFPDGNRIAPLADAAGRAAGDVHGGLRHLGGQCGRPLAPA